MLTLEIRPIEDKTVRVGAIEMTPPIGEDYWMYRVKLTDKQAVIGFPKFSTFGVGFAQEEYDWNTNLPYTVEAERILEHIRCNKGDDAISDDDCLAAIHMIQDAIRRQKETQINA